MNKLLGYREEQKKIYEADESLNLGDVTTVNLTYMAGGVQMNVVPNEFTVGFDIRITPTTNMAEFEAQVSPLTMYYIYIIKGQLILECPFGVFKSPKKPTNVFPGFLP